MIQADEKQPKEQSENCITKTAPTRRRLSVFSSSSGEEQVLVDSPRPPCDDQYKKCLEEYWDKWSTAACKTRSREIIKSIDDGIPLREKLKNVKLDPHRQAILDEADQILQKYTATATDLITTNEIRKEELKFRINRMNGFISAFQPK